MAGKKRCAFVPAASSDADANSENTQQAERCKIRAVAFAGDCTLCNASFCSQHRYPEHHDCPGREQCKMQELKRLKDKLMGEQTVASKIVMA